MKNSVCTLGGLKHLSNIYINTSKSAVQLKKEKWKQNPKLICLAYPSLA